MVRITPYRAIVAFCDALRNGKGAKYSFKEANEVMKRLTLTSLVAIALLTGCSNKEPVIPDVPASELYQEAVVSLNDGNWNTAIKQLEALDSRYPFGAYSEQVQLDLVYAYYKNKDYTLAIATIDRFIRINPSYPQMDWVMYMRGLTYMAQDSSLLHDMMNLDRSDRDPEPARQAFTDFRVLLQRFPNSQYAKDTQQRMIALKNRIADYELATADFYLRREAWVAVINRSQELQKQFPDTEAARKSLLLMKQAYEALNMEKPAKNTAELIAKNPI